MIRFELLLFIILITIICNVTTKMIMVNGKFFEYELPNRTVTMCPSYSLISLECPQIPSLLDRRSWQPNLPKYLISIEYIRSFPLRLGFDASSCQPDLLHACNNYDLRYINSLCNGRPQCSDISAYQIRERSLCAFKAVTEIGFHCVPTWNINEIQTRLDICKNTSLTNDYGFIHSRNYPSKTVRMLCSTTIYTRPNHKTMLYFVNGELNHDQLRIESVTADGITILNITLNGNITTQRLAASTYKIKITFIPSHIYSYHPTYYLLYYYTIPFCSTTDPCVLGPSSFTSPPITSPIITNRMRVQSIGWTRVPNVWIVVPIIFAYILLLLLIVALALLFQRRRKQKKVLDNTSNTNVSSRYLDASGTSSRVQLVPSLLSPPGVNNNLHETYLPRHRSSLSESFHHPLPTSSYIQNMDQYYRENQNDFDLHQNGFDGINYRHHSSIPYRLRSLPLNDNNKGYGTMDYSSFNYDINRHRRSLPKSFSDCNLCKRRVADEEYQQYLNGQDDNWQFGSTFDRRAEQRTYRDKIKDRSRERSTAQQSPGSDGATRSSATTVEYSTVLPRQQRINSEAARSNGPVHHLPFEYVQNEPSNNIHKIEFKRNLSQSRLTTGNTQQYIPVDESGVTNMTMRFYEHDDNDTKHYPDQPSRDGREVQEMSMRMNEQQSLKRNQYRQQQRRFSENTSEI